MFIFNSMTIEKRPQIFLLCLNPLFIKNIVHGEKRFACEQCGKKYTKRDILQNHVNSAHLGIFYPCTLCKSVHNRKSNLDKHIRKYHS